MPNEVAAEEGEDVDEDAGAVLPGIHMNMCICMCIYIYMHYTSG